MQRLAILVTGSRDWRDSIAIGQALLEAAGTQITPPVLIHGACRGADRLAASWAKAAGWTVLTMPAPFRTLGLPAGPQRNEKMLEVLKALRFCDYSCEVHAFPLPESKGTPGMMAMARDAGFRVHDHGRSE